MTSKILVFLLLVCTASCQQLQQEEDDGSYSPEKYEKPYENLVDVNPPDVSTPVPPPNPNSFLSGFSQPQPIQPFQQPQQQPFFQQPQNTPPVQQNPNPTAQNPFPQNPFFQQLRNSESQTPNPPFQAQNPRFQPQNPAPQNNPFFQQPNPSFQPQQEPSFPPSSRDPAPVSQFIDGSQPVTGTNFQTDNGIQRTETIDSEGNVQGQYSYIDPNGKTITVRYTAGKDGFRVEGDNIPKVPDPQPQTEEPPQQPPTQPQFNQPQRQFNQPQPQFNQPQPPSIPRQFNAVRSQLDVPRSRFNTPAPQEFFSPPDPPSRPRSRFVNGIFQPSFQPRNVQPQPSEQNQASFDFRNQNSEYDQFQTRF